MPALLTSTSTGPWCSSTSVNARSTASASVTSHCTPKRPSGAPLPRWVTATASPCSAKDRAMASPIPRLPPVTSTDLPTSHSPAPTAVSPPNLVRGRRSHPFPGSCPRTERQQGRPGGAQSGAAQEGGGNAPGGRDQPEDDG